MHEYMSIRLDEKTDENDVIFFSLPTQFHFDEYLDKSRIPDTDSWIRINDEKKKPSISSMKNIIVRQRYEVCVCSLSSGWKKVNPNTVRNDVRRSISLPISSKNWRSSWSAIARFFAFERTTDDKCVSAIDETSCTINKLISRIENLRNPTVTFTYNRRAWWNFYRNVGWETDAYNLRRRKIFFRLLITYVRRRTVA